MAGNIALQRDGVAAFRVPEGCADAINAYLNWRAPRAQICDGGHLDPVRKLLADAGEGAIDSARAANVFSALGIVSARHVKVSVEAAVEGFDLPPSLAFPVAVKILSPDIRHKTEAGGVALDVSGNDELRAACKRILASVKDYKPDARLTGLQIEMMEKGLAEAIIGYRRDPCVGPVVMVGAGGVLAEIYRDVSVRTAPVDLPTACEMIEEVRAFAPLRGYRELPLGDLDALARALMAVSQLALLNTPGVREAEINPILVKPKGQGVIAVDGVLILADKQSGPRE